MNDIDKNPAWKQEVVDFLAEFERRHTDVSISAMASDEKGMYASIRNKDAFIDQLYTLVKENPDAGAAMLNMLMEWLEEARSSLLPATILNIEPNTIKS